MLNYCQEYRQDFFVPESRLDQIWNKYLVSGQGAWGEPEGKLFITPSAINFLAESREYQENSMGPIRLILKPLPAQDFKGIITWIKDSNFQLCASYDPLLLIEAHKAPNWFNLIVPTSYQVAAEENQTMLYFRQDASGISLSTLTSSELRADAWLLVRQKVEYPDYYV